MEKIFEPIHVKSLHTRNRLVVSAMVSRMANKDGTMNEQIVSYYEAKAKGGWGLIITEDYCVSPAAGASLKLPGLYSDEQIESHKNFTSRIHQAGGSVVCQIYHAGREAVACAVSGYPLVGPSAEYNAAKKELVKELTIEEIQEIVRQFADCAARVKKAGFDGVEIHGASGYLIGQFVSPYLNKRSDEYGGTTQGRCKLAVDIIKAVREKVGDDFAILYRMAVNEYVEGGLETEEAKVVAKILEEAGVDMLHCTQGLLAKTRPCITAAYHITKGSYVENAAAIKAVVNIPVIGVGGRINDPLMAEEILQAGKMDMVTMARASIADPELPQKAKEGRLEDIIQCIGCVQGCQGGAVRGEGIRCLVNPLTGMEYAYQITPAQQKKKILVAGGGVAGCEFAMMAAERGHEVTLYEAEAVLGGQWRAASVPLGKHEFSGFIQWQKRQMERNGVKIIFNTPLTKDIVLREAPDIVAIATGSRPSCPPIKGLHETEFVFAKDILLGKKAYGSNVLVVGGGLVGAETAEYLALRGAKVTIAEMLAEIAKEAVANPRKLLLDSLKQKEVQIYTQAKVQEIMSGRAVLEVNGQNIVLEGIDTVVIAAGSKAYNPLKDELGEFKGQIMLLGDANKVKDGLFNIREGYEMGILV